MNPRHPLSACSASLLILLLTACGGGGGGADTLAAAIEAPPAEATTGNLLLAVTDAEGDFLSYAVDVTGIELVTPSGRRTSAIAAPVRVDFAELTELTELIGLREIPPGRYREISFTLDYGTAEVVLQDENGEPRVAMLRDAEGAAPGELTVPLTLEDANGLTITPGRTARLTLDFDLEASNTIESFDPPVVVVEPFLLADAALDRERPLRLRGTVTAIETDAFSVQLFAYSQAARLQGEVSLAVDDDTFFAIDGETFRGPDGLAALDLDDPVLLRARALDDGLLALMVFGGEDAAWDVLDGARGVVVARTGDTLSLQGVKLELRNGGRSFVDDLTVQLDADTRVLRDDGTVDSSAVAVGALVRVYGDFDEASGSLAAARVRIAVADALARVVEPEPLVVELLRLNGRRSTRFDFSGAGMTPADDPRPARYEIDTAMLPLADITAGDLVRLRGDVADHGFAPPDFSARSLTDLAADAVAARLKVKYRPPSATALDNVGPDGFDLLLEEAVLAELRLRGVLRIGGQDWRSAQVRIVPREGAGRFALKVGRGSRTFRDFATFAAAVIEALDAGAAVRDLKADGRFDADSTTLTAANLSLRLTLRSEAGDDTAS